MEYSVLYSRWQCNPHYPLHHVDSDLHLHKSCHPDRLPGTYDHSYHDDGGDYPGKEGGKPCTKAAQSESVDRYGIACDVYEIHHKGYNHGDVRFTHASAYCAAAVCHCKEREGDRNGQKVHDCRIMDALFYRAEYEMYYRFPEDKEEHHYDECKAKGEVDQLLGRG